MHIELAPPGRESERKLVVSLHNLQKGNAEEGADEAVELTITYSRTVLRTQYATRNCSSVGREGERKTIPKRSRRSSI